LGILQKGLLCHQGNAQFAESEKGGATGSMV
jgi:hypothetical protein